MSTFGDELREQLADVLAGGKWLCVGLAAVGARQAALEVAEAANGRAAAVAGITPFGDDGEADNAVPVFTLDLESSGDVVDDLLRVPELLSAVGPEVTEQIDAWDVEQSARLLVPPFMTDQAIVGRSMFGARPSRWATLEDKLVIGELWEQVGIDVSASHNVALVDQSALLATHQDVASAAGSVWAVDNGKGMHGGAYGTRWVPDEDSVGRLGQQLIDDGYRQVRVMPFLIGVPCSIHGVVFDQRTVALRPNEMLVFADSESGRFRYSRAANFWDPEPGRRLEMMQAVVAVGDELRETVGFRGVFTLDGVMTDDGFRPTEVNPRYGVALRSRISVANGNELDLFLLNMALVEGVIDIDPDRFEQWLLPILDADRSGGGVIPTDRGPDDPRAGVVTFVTDVTDLTVEGSAGSGELCLTDVPAGDVKRGDGGEGLAVVRWVPYGGAGLLLVSLGDRCPIGPASAPLLVQVVELADRHWNCGIEQLVPAMSVT